MLLELGGVRLLTDPVLRARVAHLRRHGPPPPAPGAVDAVLISHLHFDHLDLRSLRALTGSPPVVVPRGAGDFLRRAGFEAVELAPGEGMEVAGLPVRAVPAVHGAGRRPLGGPRAEPLGFVIGDGTRVYFAGDTELFEDMAELRPLDLALLPVAGWGPNLGPGHLDAAAAARAVALLQPRLAVPIHWGTLHPLYAGLGDWFSDPPQRFATQVATLAPHVAVCVLRPGESLALPA